MIKLTDYKKSDILVIVIRDECQTHSVYAIDDTRYINKINDVSVIYEFWSVFMDDPKCKGIEHKNDDKVKV